MAREAATAHQQSPTHDKSTRQFRPKSIIPLALHKIGQRAEILRRDDDSHDVDCGRPHVQHPPLGSQTPEPHLQRPRRHSRLLLASSRLSFSNTLPTASASSSSLPLAPSTSAVSDQEKNKSKLSYSRFRRHSTSLPQQAESRTLDPAYSHRRSACSSRDRQPRAYTREDVDHYIDHGLSNRSIEARRISLDWTHLKPSPDNAPTFSEVGSPESQPSLTLRTATSLDLFHLKRGPSSSTTSIQPAHSSLGTTSSGTRARAAASSLSGFARKLIGSSDSQHTQVPVRQRANSSTVVSSLDLKATHFRPHDARSNENTQAGRSSVTLPMGRRTDLSVPLSPRSASPSSVRHWSHASDASMSAMKRGWTMLQGWTESSSTSLADPPGERKSINADSSHAPLNAATRAWRSFDCGDSRPTSQRASLIFGIPLSEGVCRTRIDSPVFRSWSAGDGRPWSSYEQSGDDRQRASSDVEFRALRQHPPDLGHLDLGDHFFYSSSFFRQGSSEASVPQTLATSDNLSSGPLGNDIVATALSSIDPLDRETARRSCLPRFATRCLESLETMGLEEEGIYRLSGRPSHTAKLRFLFDGQCNPPWRLNSDFAWDLDLKSVSPADCDINSVCSVWKSYLRELPCPLLSNQQLQRLQPFVGKPDFDQEAARYALRDVPISEWYLLRELAMHLSHLSYAEIVAKTKMTLVNLSLVLAPTLAIPVHLLRFIVEEHRLMFARLPSTGTQERKVCHRSVSCNSKKSNKCQTDAARLNRQSNASSVSTVLAPSDGCTVGRPQFDSEERPTEAAPALPWLGSLYDPQGTRTFCRSSAGASTVSLSFSETDTSSLDLPSASTFVSVATLYDIQGSDLQAYGSSVNAPEDPLKKAHSTLTVVPTADCDRTKTGKRISQYGARPVNATTTS